MATFFRQHVDSNLPLHCDASTSHFLAAPHAFELGIDGSVGRLWQGCFGLALGFCIYWRQIHTIAKIQHLCTKQCVNARCDVYTSPAEELQARRIHLGSRLPFDLAPAARHCPPSLRVSSSRDQ
jgi:hypothetical protein